MGIADRAYIRDNNRGSGGFGLGTGGPLRLSGLSVITWLIAINIAVFVVDLMLPTVSILDGIAVDRRATQQQIDRAVPLNVEPPSPPEPGKSWQVPLIDPTTNQQVGAKLYRTWHALNGFGHFSLAKGFLSLEVWRVVTYQFLHANVSHLFFNMFGLFMFGGMVEQFLGRKKFLSFYLLCGISGGLLYLLIVGFAALGMPLPGTLGATSIYTPLIGASGAVFGVIVACAKISPNQSVYLLLLPIPLKLKWLAYGYVAIAAFNLISGGSNAGGDAAHIGGAIAGYFYIRNTHLLRGFLDFGIGPAPKNSGGGHPRPAGGPATRLERQADKILEKVHEKGMQSLTAREKRILNKSARSGERS